MSISSLFKKLSDNDIVRISNIYPGMEYDQDKIQKGIKKLWDLNRFNDIQINIDNESSRIASVYFKETDVFCDLCETNICLHTDFAYSIPKVLEALKRRGHTIQQNYHKV